MKTMWFTFLYGRLIPISYTFSFFGILIYYWVDKYVVIKNRCIKEEIGIELSLHMLDMLSFILFFFTAGNTYFYYDILGYIPTIKYLTLSLAILYVIMPQEKLNELFFKIDEPDEVKEYDEATLHFD